MIVPDLYFHLHKSKNKERTLKEKRKKIESWSALCWLLPSGPLRTLTLSWVCTSIHLGYWLSTAKAELLMHWIPSRTDVTETGFYLSSEVLSLQRRWKRRFEGGREVRKLRMHHEPPASSTEPTQKSHSTNIVRTATLLQQITGRWETAVRESPLWATLF